MYKISVFCLEGIEVLSLGLDQFPIERWTAEETLQQMKLNIPILSMYVLCCVGTYNKGALAPISTMWPSRYAVFSLSCTVASAVRSDLPWSCLFVIGSQVLGVKTAGNWCGRTLRQASTLEISVSASLSCQRCDLDRSVFSHRSP